MQITKKEEKNALKAYKTYFESYIGGDVESIAALLDDNYTQIGSAEAEVFFDKKEAIQFLYNTIDQVAEKAEMRNRLIKTERLDGHILVIEQFDMYVLIDNEWTFYSKLRASTLMVETETGWKFVYQHSSMPDTRALDGNNIAIEKISEENQQLREAVKRRTVELEGKNKELEIEAALERVRARTMAMQHSDEMPEVANNLFLQVQELGLPAWSAGYCIWEENKKSANCSMSSEGVIQKSFSLPTIGVGYDFSTPLKNGQKFYVAELGGKELVEHYKFMRKLPVVGEVLDGILTAGFDLPTFQIFHIVYYKHGYLMFITYEPVPDAHDLFKRFASVFEQTYTRFLDLQKAEAQAREAQIEASLERVRAASMAMHASDELRNVVRVIFDQLASLDINAEHAGIVVDYETKSDWHFWIAETQDIPAKVSVPYLDLVWDRQFTQAKKNGEDFFTTQLNFEQKNSFYTKLLPHIKGLTRKAKNFYLKCSGLAISTSIQEDVALYIENFSGTPYTEDENKNLKRFTKVFQQTYTRFLDLKKAEAQAREAHIESALEKVRSRSLAMHKSDELNEVVSILFERLKELQIPATAVGIAINIDGSKDLNGFVCGENEDGLVLTNYRLPYFNNKISKDISKVLRKQLDFFVGHYSIEEKNSFYEYLLEHTAEFRHLPKDIKRMIFESPLYTISMVAVKNAVFNINDFEGKVLSDDEVDIIQRFARVFEQTYTRFLDLQKAEAQTREAQIETALEKVRSKSLAMHNSAGLAEIGNEVFLQLDQLGINAEASWLWFIGQKEDEIEIWFSHDNTLAKKITVSSKDYQTFAHEIQAWKDGVPYLKLTIPKPDAKKIIKKYFGITLKGGRTTDHYHLLQARHEYGFLGLGSWQQPSESERHIYMRFAKVFEQAYTRFLDLQNAEAQGREAQIEAALERVRSKSMAMHKSEDIGETVSTLFDELLKVGIHKSSRSGIGILNETKNMKLWSAISNSADEVNLLIGNLDMMINPLLKKIKNAWKKQEEQFYYELEGKELSNYYASINQSDGYALRTDLNKLPEKEFIHVFTFKHGIIYSFNSVPISEEANQVFKRFAKVFEQTYTRYLDLQKAEAQAREAQIEVALERVRSQAMAMQLSDDLIKCTTSVFEELEKLELPVKRSGIGIFDEETKGCQLWTTVVDKKGKMGIATGITSLTIHPLLIETFNAWKAHESYSYVLEGKELLDYYKVISKGDFNLPKDVIGSSTSLPKEYYIYAPFGAGGIYLFAESEPTASDRLILRRFAEVFHLTYTRYEDLQKAEARALEAIRQASLDRIRGEISSMRSTEDLQRITPLVWKELLAMQVPFVRCGVFIMDDTSSNIKAYLSAPDGHSLGVLNLPFDSTEFTKGAVDHWHQQKMYKVHWNKQQFQENMKSMIDNGQIIHDAANNRGPEKPPESLHLHFISFKQGLLYAGNSEALSTEALESVKSLADSFSIAYSRYEDFRQLETAMNELKSTQSQLIHSEKMASLGELTAGIAHEIQNPLNFVNNFSEINKELIEELQEELQKGDLQEANAIAKDIIDNEEKIVHHGKRAEGIVKGMLQHSRTSSGEKEITDINELADEYLRLSYHGLRAKDKSFNADFKTDLDPALPKLEVVAQDIGRVLLNLINNAFHAVKDAENPKVTVSTKSLKDKVEIFVSDNGSGIPDDIKEKIFQPFFTTKATGEGTGLGLSLSYDIVTKGHGGELEVTSKLGNGATFVIKFPVK